MAQTFTVQIKDDVKHRIVIEKTAWELEDLKKGDYIRVTIEKIKI